MTGPLRLQTVGCAWHGTVFFVVCFSKTVPVYRSCTTRPGLCSVTECVPEVALKTEVCKDLKLVLSS